MKYEYKYALYCVRYAQDRIVMEEDMNEFGADGYKLIGFTPMNEYYVHAVFMKEIPDITITRSESNSRRLDTEL